MAWMSTLDIHGYGEGGAAFEIAADNLARFSARGGTVLYGTDLGNGPLPAGLNGRELAALVEGERLGAEGHGDVGGDEEDLVDLVSVVQADLRGALLATS